jgi:hypothetical protein
MADGNGTKPAPSIGAGVQGKAEDIPQELPPALMASLPPIPRTLVDPHGNLDRPAILPGWEGLPFKGASIPTLKEDDPDRRQPKIGSKAHIEVLDMSQEAHLKRYQDIMQTVANGFGAIGAEDRVYDKGTKNWRVFIRWWELYSYMPERR